MNLLTFQTAWVRTLPLLFISLGNSLNLSVPLLPHPRDEDNHSTNVIMLLEGVNEVTQAFQKYVLMLLICLLLS